MLQDNVLLLATQFPPGHLYEHNSPIVLQQKLPLLINSMFREESSQFLQFFLVALMTGLHKNSLAVVMTSLSRPCNNGTSLIFFFKMSLI